MSVEVVRDDITTLPVDAIVNAANPSLLGGGGVDGAIHRAAGPALLEACRAITETSPGVRCPPGEARLTAGFGLPATYVIHTVGPLWRGGGHGEARILASCYQRCLQVAATHGLSSIAFPAISCGVYGYPADQAAVIATEQTRRAGDALRVVLCSFDDSVTDALHRALARRR